MKLVTQKWRICGTVLSARRIQLIWVKVIPFYLINYEII